MRHGASSKFRPDSGSILLRNVDRELSGRTPAAVLELRLQQFSELLAVPPPRGAGMTSVQISDAERILQNFSPSGPVCFGFNQNIGFFSEMAGVLQDGNVGGAGITSRSLEQHEFAMPGFTRRLEAEKGKILVLGNGFSALALELGERHARGLLQEKPVIVDMLDYDQARRDLLELGARMAARAVPFPFLAELQTLHGISEFVQRGNLAVVRHYFGVGSSEACALPALEEAQLAVNCFGPAPVTLSEQLRTLAPGGELWLAAYVPEELGSRYQIRPFPLPQFEGRVAQNDAARFLWGSIIQREAASGAPH